MSSLAIAFFFPALFGGEVFAFRDAGHYYYRLFEWSEAEWRDGNTPLWNPLENLGTPVVADATASLFYPPKLMLHAPLGSFYWRYNAYTIGHLLLAAWGAFWLMRRIRQPVASSLLSAVMFAFGGVLLTQVSNVVFLVGAAWLPFAMGALLQLKKRGSRAVFELAFSLAMMVLGGDPQMAYHVVLLGLLWAWLQRRDSLDCSTPIQSVDGRNWVRNLIQTIRGAVTLHRLGWACLVALGLCAVQVLPSLSWSRQSSRAIYERPRSVYEAAAFTAREIGSEPKHWYRHTPWDISDGLTGDPVLGSHHDHAYQFSVPPWTLIESFLPNFSGRGYPKNRRWSNALPGADRVWHSSLYIGTIGVLLSLAAWRVSRCRLERRWISWVLLLSVFTSFGWFGVGWLLRETMSLLAGTAPHELRIGAPVGGIYWLLMTFAPFYAQFRYPAKWLVISCLAAALLAGMALPRISAATFRRRLLWTTWGATFTLLVGTLLIDQTTIGWFEERAADPLHGPLQGRQALRDLRSSLGLACASTTLMLIASSVGSRWPRCRRVLSALVVALFTVDLLVANHWIAATVPHQSLDRQTSAIDRIIADSDGESTQRWYRGNLYQWLPPTFANRSSEDRLIEHVEWDSATLFPKHQLSRDVAIVDSFSSVSSADLEVFHGVARQMGPIRRDGERELPSHVLDLMGVSRIVVPEPGCWLTEEAKDRGLEVDAQLVAEQAWYEPREAPLPRAWLVDHVEVVSPPRSRTRLALSEATVATFLDKDGNLRDFRQVAVIESNDNRSANELDRDTPRHAEMEPTHDRNSDVSYSRTSSQAMEIGVATSEPSFLVISEFYDPGWRAYRTSASDGSQREPLNIVRTNRVMCGVWLPAGEWNVKLEYQPASYEIGKWASIGAWSLLITVIGWHFGRSRWRKTKPRSAE